VRRGAQRLLNLQNPDGSFGWFQGGSGDLAMTAYAFLGLAGAQEAGVSGLDGALGNAANALANLLRQGDENARALGHYALSRVRRVESEAYATTFRRRNDDLSIQGLAWMTLAAKNVGRDYDADELLRLILERRVEEGNLTSWKAPEGDCLVGSSVEATGLAVQAILAAGGDVRHAERGLEWMLANRQGGGFGSTKATAAFVQAAAAWVRKNGAQGFGGKIDLLLDGKVVRTVSVGREGLEPKDRRFLVDEAADLAPGRHTLAFRLDGQGRLHWALRLETVVASEDLPGLTHGLTLERSFLRPEEAPVEGQPPPVKPGYTILRESARPRIEAKDVTAVSAGDRVLVRVKLTAPRDLSYVLVEDPLPAGFEVLDETAKGPFDWQERRDDRQVFFLGKVPKGSVTLEYVLQATHWGRFTALGTSAYPMYLPEVHGRAPGHAIEVVRGKGAGVDVETPPTPDELYGVALRLFDEEKYAEAAQILRPLRDEQPLRDEIVEEIEARLLRGAIATKDAKEIVRAREALVRRNGSRIPDDWDSQRAIAFAYQTLGEYEVAIGLGGQLVARGFGLHGDWARTLAERDREAEGLDQLGDALAAFPVSNATADAAFRRAQRYRDLARPKGRDLPEGKPMDEEALDALWAFTAHYADTSLADPGNYAVVEALRRAGDREGAVRAAEAFLQRFPGSPFEDDTRYFLAEGRYREFEAKPTAEGAKAVQEAAEPLVSRKFPGRDGRPAESEFKDRAYHLLARVQHVLGRLDEAIRLYWAARSLEDAREAHAFLTEVRLDVDASVTHALEGKPKLPVRYQNVSEIALKAYPVDLQVLFTVRKTLEGLNEIDLSGIVPTHEWKAPLAGGADHLGHEGEIELPVEAGKAGAWLIVAKAGDREAKSLVIQTDLQVVLQRIGEKVRVHVTDAEGQPVREAFVTVADGSRIQARGLTDGRGLFEAPGVGAKAAVVVSKADRYAIAR
jgi:TolA-binding protein